MALPVRIASETGRNLSVSLERLADALFYDVPPVDGGTGDGTFKPSPTSPTKAMIPGTGIFAGSYSVTFSSTPIGQFTDGDYAVRIHDDDAAGLTIAILPAACYLGSFATVFPGSGPGGAPTVAEIVAGVFARLIDGMTFAEATSLSVAFTAGDWTIDPDGTIHFLGIDGASERIVRTFPTATSGHNTLTPGS